MTEQQPREQSRPQVDNVPVSELISQVTADLSRLMRQELELAKTELREEAAKTGKAAGMLGGAGFGGYLIVVFASLALMFGLGAVMPLGWAALIVAAVWSVVSAVLYTTGRRQLRRVNPVPQQTVETVKEDVRWARTRTS